MRASGQKLVKFCAHTHTHAAKFVVRIRETAFPLSQTFRDIMCERVGNMCLYCNVLLNQNGECTANIYYCVEWSRGYFSMTTLC